MSENLRQRATIYQGRYRIDTTPAAFAEWAVDVDLGAEWLIVLNITPNSLRALYRQPAGPVVIEFVAYPTTAGCVVNLVGYEWAALRCERGAYFEAPAPTLAACSALDAAICAMWGSCSELEPERTPEADTPTSVLVQSSDLTPRERQIAALFARGYTRSQICAQLHVVSIDSSCAAIRRKWGLERATQEALQAEAKRRGY